MALDSITSALTLSFLKNVSLGSMGKGPFPSEERPKDLGLFTPEKNWHWRDFTTTCKELLGSVGKGESGKVQTEYRKSLSSRGQSICGTGCPEKRGL